MALFAETTWTYLGRTVAFKVETRGLFGAEYPLIGSVKVFSAYSGLEGTEK